MTIGFDYQKHIFNSPQFQSIVDQAIQFFNQTPVHKLPPPDSFVGTGVYALFYLGNYNLYTEIATTNRQTCTLPIYVGKAVPPGWRTARTRNTTTRVLYQRLREHMRSIQSTNNLNVGDFACRFMILGGIESDLIIPAEAKLVRRYKPLWNAVIDGFGNHDPGKGRYNQAKSEWDTLHPGRSRAERLTGDHPNLKDVIAKIQNFWGN